MTPLDKIFWTNGFSLNSNVREHIFTLFTWSDHTYLAWMVELGSSISSSAHVSALYHGHIRRRSSLPAPEQRAPQLRALRHGFLTCAYRLLCFLVSVGCRNNIGLWCSFIAQVTPRAFSAIGWKWVLFCRRSTRLDIHEPFFYRYCTPFIIHANRLDLYLFYPHRSRVCHLWAHQVSWFDLVCAITLAHWTIQSALVIWAFFPVRFKQSYHSTFDWFILTPSRKLQDVVSKVRPFANSAQPTSPVWLIPLRNGSPVREGTIIRWWKPIRRGWRPSCGRTWTSWRYVDDSHPIRIVDWIYGWTGTFVPGALTEQAGPSHFESREKDTYDYDSKMWKTNFAAVSASRQIFFMFYLTSFSELFHPLNAKMSYSRSLLYNWRRQLTGQPTARVFDSITL